MSAYNGAVAVNSAQDATFEDVHLYFAPGSDRDLGTPGAEFDEWWDFALNPAINLNDNLGNLPAAGGEPHLSDVVIAFGGRVNEDQYLYGITAGPTNWNGVTIDGGLYWVPPSDRAAASSARRFAAIALEGTALSNHQVSGFRSYGNHPLGTHPGGDLALRIGSTGAITNNVADHVYTPTGTQSGNVSLAAWRAATDRSAPPVADFRVVDIKGEGAYDFFAYGADGTPLAYSPWGYIVRYEWEARRNGQVVWTDHTRYASGVFQPGDVVRLTVWDEDEQTATHEYVIPSP